MTEASTEGSGGFVPQTFRWVVWGQKPMFHIESLRHRPHKSQLKLDCDVVLYVPERFALEALRADSNQTESEP